MIPEKIKKILKKQHYEIVGNHSAVQICRWTKNSLRDQGVCYKEKFYGIKSHLCCQMTPAIMWCPNKCVHCWRAIEYTIGDKLPDNIDNPKKIIDGCIKAQRKLLQGFNIDPKSKKKQLSKANQKKYTEAQEPMQFAISLSGEPTLYPLIGDLISELRKRKKTSFLVTNGLYPEKLKELKNKKQLPTQLYISVNISNKNQYQKFHRSSLLDAWTRLMKSLKIMSDLKTRTVFRINLIREINMQDKDVQEFAELIKKAKSDFIEIKSYMAVGFARKRLGYDRMPLMKEMLDFSKKIEKTTGYKIEDQDERSRVVLLKRDDSVERFISKADL
ncbi:MAG: 4-demethylwyosine synthase TYW1 [Nanoarchaeota archaeon]|nr:4-demethylwyosine synthase TYW1 [Nanoarchaeota archaeon]MBU1028362.1 4-demethylwyosine synthase TYW1 [Nanoarchaeota archaeon]